MGFNTAKKSNVRDGEHTTVKQLTLEEAKKRVITSKERKPSPVSKEKAAFVQSAHTLMKYLSVIGMLRTARSGYTLLVPHSYIFAELTKHLPARTHWKQLHLYNLHDAVSYTGPREDIDIVIEKYEDDMTLLKNDIKDFKI